MLSAPSVPSKKTRSSPPQHPPSSTKPLNPTAIPPPNKICVPTPPLHPGVSKPSTSLMRRRNSTRCSRRGNWISIYSPGCCNDWRRCIMSVRIVSIYSLIRGRRRLRSTGEDRCFSILLIIWNCTPRMGGIPRMHRYFILLWKGLTIRDIGLRLLHMSWRIIWFISMERSIRIGQSRLSRPTYWCLFNIWDPFDKTGLDRLR
jgi:hypothetical protein